MFANRSRILREEIVSIIKLSWKQLFAISLLIGFLVFILNVFFAISLYTGQFGDTLKDKMWMYFYIKDVPGNENIVYKEIMDLKDSLQSQGLEVEFSSKEDAFEFLQKRIPDVISSFEKFGMDNPLPATLYVLVDDEKEYQALRTEILNHKNIILNIKDIDEWASLKQQENRILTVINLSNFVKVSSYILMWILSIIILFFLWFLLENIFQRFRNDLKIKKLLGATSGQLASSFIRLTVVVLLVAIVLGVVLMAIAAYALNFYMKELFDVTLFASMAMNSWTFVKFLVVELVLLFVISLGVSYWFVHSLNKKI